MLSQPFSTFLNVSRWVAAFLVVIAHARHLLFVDYKLVMAPNILVKGLYFFTGLGHEAVVVFFVISGYLVGGLTWQKWRLKGVDAAQYIVARTSRIYTVLIPGLLIGGLLDLIGLHWFNQSELYTASPRYQSSMNSVIADNLNIETLLGNLAMLQGIAVPRLGSNAPLWSLANEWWYYCIFALVAAGVIARGLRRIGCFAAVAVLAWFLPAKLVLWIVIWGLGLLAAMWIEYGKRIPHPWVGAVLFAVFLIISRLSHSVENVEGGESLFDGFLRDLSLGLAYAVFLVAATRLRWNLLLPDFHRRFANFSYSTYVFHFPIMVLIVAMGYQFLGIGIQIQPTLSSAFYITLVVGFVYLCCFLFSCVFERQTDSIRRLMTKVSSN